MRSRHDRVGMRTTWAAGLDSDPPVEATVVGLEAGAIDGPRDGVVTGALIPDATGTFGAVVTGGGRLPNVSEGTVNGTVGGGAPVVGTAVGDPELNTSPAVTGSNVASNVGVPSGSSTKLATPATASFDNWKVKVRPSVLNTPLTCATEQSPEGRVFQLPGPGPGLQFVVVGQATIPDATVLAGWAELTWRARTGSV